jgi:hypothetical protein
LLLGRPPGAPVSTPLNLQRHLFSVESHRLLFLRAEAPYFVPVRRLHLEGRTVRFMGRLDPRVISCVQVGTPPRLYHPDTPRHPPNSLWLEKQLREIIQRT